MQGDFSVLDRKSEENGVAEAISPYNENVGFMAYNALAGGMLTGKYSGTYEYSTSRWCGIVMRGVRKQRH